MGVISWRPHWDEDKWGVEIYCPAVWFDNQKQALGHKQSINQCCISFTTIEGMVNWESNNSCYWSSDKVLTQDFPMLFLLPLRYQKNTLPSVHNLHQIFNTVRSYWAWWRLKSPAARLFTQPFVQAQIKTRQNSTQSVRNMPPPSPRHLLQHVLQIMPRNAKYDQFQPKGHHNEENPQSTTKMAGNPKFDLLH